MLAGDRHILSLLKDHNPRGLESLFASYYRPLVLWADTFLNDVAASEDLVQEFFIGFWERQLYRRLSTTNLKGYLFASVRNAALNHLEKRDPLKNAVAVHLLRLESLEAEEFLSEQMLRAIAEEIEKLPPRTQAVLKGVYVDGLHYSEVAQRLGIAVSTVKTLLVNALKKLRSIFSRSG